MAGSPVELALERHVAAVQTSDREAFLSNFAEDAIVEDPVGANPLEPTGLGHHGRDAIGAFWDVMIGPGQVRFDFRQSFVCGNEVANVGTVYNIPPGATEEIAADGVFVYRVNDAGKLISLKAYWDYEKTMSGVEL
jgi:steroid Delta-isomerase